MKTLKEIFGVEKPIIGMLHMTGLNLGERMVFAKEEIEIMYRCGVDAVLVENYFGDAVDVEHALQYLQKEYTDKVYGINMLGDPDLAFELARKYGAKFVQIDSVCGHLPLDRDAEYADYIKKLRGDGDIFLMGGVRFKHTPYQSGRSLEEDLHIATGRCDAIVVTGAGTGIETKLEKIKSFRDALSDFPLIVGAGVTAETAAQQLAYADGAIVGTGFKELGITEYPVDEEQVEKLLHNARK